MRKNGYRQQSESVRKMTEPTKKAAACPQHADADPEQLRDQLTTGCFIPGHGRPGPMTPLLFEYRVPVPSTRFQCGVPFGFLHLHALSFRTGTK